MKTSILIIYFSLFLFYNIKGQDTLLIPTEDVLKEYSCFSPHKNGKAVLIRNMNDAKTDLRQCKNVISIDSLVADFTNHDLIFCNATSGGNVKEFSNYLYKIPSQKKYYFLVKIKYGKYVPAVNYFRPLVRLTPKLDVDYKFEYKILEVYTNIE
jgi:hypothetical protein